MERERVKRDDGPLARAIRLGEVVEDELMLYRTGSGRTIVVRISAAARTAVSRNSAARWTGVGCER